MHIAERNVREWIQQRIESDDIDRSPSRDMQLRILTRLTDAVIFEEFVRKKYLGATTFSLEGAETLVPLLDLALEAAAEDGVIEVVMAMAHRGRLNVLANICGKRPADIFREFDDPYSDWYRGRGDVKYHLGASGDWLAANGSKLHISLCFNPSHLEYVNPIAMGRIRAKQDRIGDYRAPQRHVRSHSRRCRVRRRRCRAGIAQPERSASLLHRRHAARDPQQPGRFHHRPGRRSLEHLLPATWRRCCRCRSST